MLLRPPRNKIKSEKGGLLVEIVVVVGIIVGALVAILGLATTFLVTSQIVQQTSEATSLAQEGLEIVRSYRDGIPWDQNDVTDEYDGFGILDYVPVYHSVLDSPPQWKFVSGSETIGEFTRQIQFEEVCRNGSADIIPCGSPVDPDTVKATVTVSWEERGRSHQVELEAYFTHWNQ